MATDDLKTWVDCIRNRRYQDLTMAVWDLLWLAAQHRRFVLRPKAGVGLEFLLAEQGGHVYPLADNVGWLRTILARMASLLTEQGAVTAGNGLYGFKARIKMPDETGVDRAYEIEMKNNQREGVSLLVCQAGADTRAREAVDAAPPASAE